MNMPPILPDAARLADRIRAHDTILIASHGNPDGDAIGSTAAMGHLLLALGKEVMLYNATGLPEPLRWVPLPGKLHDRVNRLPRKPELVIALDCGDMWRLGNDLADAMPRFASLNIDHHLGNPCFGSLDNWVDPSMAATGQMVAALADALQVPLTGELAECLYLALVADTGSFSHGNTTAAVLSLAARLVELGLDAAAVRDKLDNQWSLAKTRLWGRLMQTVRLDAHDEVAVCGVMRADIEAVQAHKDDLEGFVEQMRRLRGVRVALLAREDGPARTKISLRSTGDDDVRSVACLYGGGGHKNAAGATLDLDLASAIRHSLHDLREMVLR